MLLNVSNHLTDEAGLDLIGIMAILVVCYYAAKFKTWHQQYSNHTILLNMATAFGY